VNRNAQQEEAADIPIRVVIGLRLRVLEGYDHEYC